MAFFLTFFLPFYPTLFPLFYLAFFLAFYLASFEASILAFYLASILTHNSDIVSDISSGSTGMHKYSGILSGIHSGILSDILSAILSGILFGIQWFWTWSSSLKFLGLWEPAGSRLENKHRGLEGISFPHFSTTRAQDPLQIQLGSVQDPCSLILDYIIYYIYLYHQYIWVYHIPAGESRSQPGNQPGNQPVSSLATAGTNYWHTRMSKHVCDRRMSWAKRVFASKHPGEKGVTKTGGIYRRYLFEAWVGIFLEI